MKLFFIIALVAVGLKVLSQEKNVEVQHGVHDDMVHIHLGEFLMGDHYDGNSDALPTHRVRLEPFFMGRYEITNRQYCDFLNSAIIAGNLSIDNGIVYNISDTLKSYPYCNTHTQNRSSQIIYTNGVFKVLTKDAIVDMYDHPVIYVSWYGAAAYCNWKSIQEGYESCYNLSTWECSLSKNGYRLPLESEWEYAARGGKHSPYLRFPLGNEINGSMANFWKSGDPFERGEYPYTTPVGYFNGKQIPAGSDMSNGYGLYDMEGNVQEWCNDWYRFSYININPTNNSNEAKKGTFRVLRGGFWKGLGYFNHFNRNSFRYHESPDNRNSYAGFRIVRKTANFSDIEKRKQADTKQQPNDMRIWYKQPAEEWENGLPIGNGQVGAMVLGGIPKERVLLNHNRLWRNTKHQSNKTPEVGHLLKNVQELFFEGKYAKAAKASVFRSWTPPEKFAVFGDLYINFPGHEKNNITNYQSELDLATGIAKVSYVHDGTTYVRETFVSRADDVIVVRLSANKENAITSDIELSRINDPDCDVFSWADGNRIGFLGRFKEGVHFAGAAQVYNYDGKLIISDNQTAKISIKKSNEVLIILSLTTSNRLEEDNAKNKVENIIKNDECVISCNLHLDKIKEDATFLKLSGRHIAKHKKLFDRVDISFGSDTKSNIPTDERLALFSAGEDDPGLIPLQFQFGRYVLISTSRPGSLPANLQGIWNGDLNPVWYSAYVSDCNIEMNYWAAEVTNLSECHEALLGFYEESLPVARQAANNLFGCRGIYMGMWFDPHNPAHGSVWEWTGSAAWMAQHFWWRWEYTQDKDFLLNRAYPVYKELGMFYEDFLIEDPRPESPHFGKLVTVPSYSPEAFFIYKGREYTSTIGATMDFHLIHDVFSNLIEASKILGIDSEKREGWQYILDNIPPMQVGRYGQLQEWLEDHEEKDLYHRHISNLWGLFPSERITVEGTPGFAEAAHVSLERKIDPLSATCPWPAVRSWYAACFARLHKPELAYDFIAGNLTDDGLRYRNLITKGREGCLVGPVWQIDGNGATPAAVVEMLMQSHNGEIKLLPALPKAWPTGHVKGLIARGAFEVDIEWDNGELTKAVIESKVGNTCRIKYDTKVIVTTEGKTVKTRNVEKSVIEFDTHAGNYYVIKN